MQLVGAAGGVDERPLQGIERFWLAAERLQPGFVIQRVVEGWVTGDAFAARLRSALDAVVAVRPGLRLRLVGWGPWLRWRADGAVAVRVLDAAWDGRGPLDGLDVPIDLRRGCAELVWVRGAPDRLVLRAHHAAADGRTIDAWTLALFAALRGEPVPVGALAPPDVSVPVGAPVPVGVPAPAPRWSPPPRTATPVTGPPRPAPLRGTWAHVRVTPPPPRDVLVRVLLAIRDAHPEGLPRVSLPVDLRALGTGAVRVSGDGNLSGIATLPDDALTTADTARAAIAAARHASSGILHFAHAQRHLPLWLLTLAGRGSARSQLQAGRFEASLTVSNLGRASLPAHTCADFVATAAWWIPPPTPGNPCLLLVSGDGDGLDLCAAAPLGLAEGLPTWLATVATLLTADGRPGGAGDGATAG